MMESHELRRWGLLLGILSEMSDLERQLANPDEESGGLQPDELLERWDVTFRSGRGLSKVGISDLMIALLLDFDTQLEELNDHLPYNTEDRMAYVDRDESWRILCEMADLTLSRIAQVSMPELLIQSKN